MGHEDAGNYAGKHPPGTKVDKRIVEAIKKRVVDNGVACKSAENIADEFGVAMEEVGVNIDLMELRIIKCQLGLYGHGTKKPHGASIDPLKEVPESLESEIRSNLVDERLSCSSAWKISKKLGVPKMSIPSACDALKIKIKPCQLGAF